MMLGGVKSGINMRGKWKRAPRDLESQKRKRKLERREVKL